MGLGKVLRVRGVGNGVSNDWRDNWPEVGVLFFVLCQVVCVRMWIEVLCRIFRFREQGSFCSVQEHEEEKKKKTNAQC